VYQYEKYLQRRSMKDREALVLLDKFQLDEPLKDQRVSNVIEDNITLRKELKDAFCEINKLEMQSLKKQQTNYDLADQVDNLKKRVEELESEEPGSRSSKKNGHIIEESIRR
jgi:CCR4-NOT transcriptional regulation complex NOT5 subunit